MRSNSRELWWALAAMIAVTVLYLLAVNRAGALTESSQLVGHGIGVLGFVLMLMTETLYTIRKRLRRARWGRMASWLRFHIFTGLVGPYMVWLHTAFNYNGLAGVAMLMTVIVVASGILGRYIYTAIPRTAEGAEMAAGEVARAIAETETQLQVLLQTRPQIAAALARRAARATTPATAGVSLAVTLDRSLPITERLRWRLEQRAWDEEARGQARQLERMLARRQALKRQVTTLVSARRALGIWHSVHIPLGLALFTSAFVHAGAALYYATFLH